MRYIGLDIGDGESAAAAYERGSSIEPQILPICGVGSLLSAVGMLAGQIVIGERAYTDALADGLSVRFKSRFTTDRNAEEDIVRFARGLVYELENSRQLHPDDRVTVGCPAGWNAAARARYRELLIRAGLREPRIISESRAAFLYAKYAKTVALDIDILNESALVIDIGSSTLDFAYILEGKESGVGTFGDTELGGGVLDAALLRRAVSKSRDQEAIRGVFKESPSWYSYCEIEARKLKEEYYSSLSDNCAPELKKQLKLCYDGIQRLILKLDSEEEAHLIHDVLPELDGLSMYEAVQKALAGAARVTQEHPPRLLLLTGGASRMPFFRDLCREAFPHAVIVCCPEPEYSIAKGLAYAGWVDENLRAFREAVETEMTHERIASVAEASLPSLIPEAADALAGLITEETLIPILKEWKSGRIDTIEQVNLQIGPRMETVMSSPLAEDALAPIIRKWLENLTAELQRMIDPICDRYEVPRRQMKLDLAAACTDKVELDAGDWMGVNTATTAVGVVVSILVGMLCGGTGLAMITAGPGGFLAGVVIGLIGSLIGWDSMNKGLTKIKLPVLLRRVNVEKKLRSDTVQKEIRSCIESSLSAEDGQFRKQIAEGFAGAFRHSVLSTAQAAEIPIVS